MSTVHKVMQLWRPGQYIKPYDAGPRIGHLFGAGQQGGAYLFDKAHQASAFQGGAYDTPLSAVEQLIGSFYDLSGNANHCAQTTSTARGKWSARVNLLTKTEQFDGAAWVRTSSGTGTAPVVTPNAALAPDGTMTACQIVFDQGAGTTASDRSLISQTTAPQAVDYDGGLWLRTVSGTATLVFRHVAASPFLPILVTTTWTYFSRRELGLTGVVPFQLGKYSTLATGSSTVLAWGASLTLAIEAHLPYQRVNTATDYDTAGFPHYLLPDGADDYYTSASGGGSTTGIFICTAIAPMAAGAKQVIWTDASGNTGYELCINASNQVEFSAGTGSARVSCVSAALTLGAPKVITAQHDGTTLTVRVDGVATTAACGAASAGTAGTTLLRANGAASNYAKLQINGLVHRHGAQPSAELLTFAERLMATLQGRTL